MKKFLITLISVILCAACAFGFTACGDDDTKNPDGSPKNMAETIIDLDAETQLNSLYAWGDNGNNASSSIRMGSINTIINGATDFDKYSGFTFIWKKGSNYKITKLEFDITSQTSSTITIDCNFAEPIGGKGEYKHLSEMSIENGQTVHIVFDNLNCSYSKFAQSVDFKNSGRTTDTSVLNWQISISNLFITAEKV